MKNNSIFNIQTDLFDSILNPSNQDDPDSLEFKKLFLSNDPMGSFQFPLLIEMIQRIDHSLESIKKITRISQGRFSDKTFDDQFHRIMREEVGKVDLVLRSVLNYVKVNTSAPKSNTVHSLIENTLKEARTQMDEKKIQVFKKFEKDLPETIVPDEHLKYILDSTLQYAVRWMPPNGFIGFITRSYVHSKEQTEASASSIEEKKYIEISVLFDGYRKPVEPFKPIFRETSPVKTERRDFELRLIEEMVKKNKGVMQIEVDEKKGRTFISLRFPVERRKIVQHQLIN